VQVRVLGSIEVTRDGQAIRLAGQGQRAVLGALALEQGRPVSVERLAEAIWQFSPPATSRTKIQAHVCALWRGPAFADAVSPVLRSAAGPLAERRVLTVEAKAEADLALGYPEVVVAELSAWLVEMPLRELLRGQLMLALYRLGCRADALNIYRAGHRIMIAEVGLEPGPQLRSLHQRLLADDPILMEPMGARAQGLLLRAPDPSPAGDARQLQRAPAATPRLRRGEPGVRSCGLRRPSWPGAWCRRPCRNATERRRPAPA